MKYLLILVALIFIGCASPQPNWTEGAVSVDVTMEVRPIEGAENHQPYKTTIYFKEHTTNNGDLLLVYDSTKDSVYTIKVHINPRGQYTGVQYWTKTHYFL